MGLGSDFRGVALFSRSLPAVEGALFFLGKCWFCCFVGVCLVSLSFV